MHVCFLLGSCIFFLPRSGCDSFGVLARHNTRGSGGVNTGDARGEENTSIYQGACNGLHRIPAV